MKHPYPELRPDLEGLTSYRSSDTREGKIFLHANENPHALPEDVLAEILATAARLDLNRYPDPDPWILVRELAAYAGVEPEQIWIGDGSNEVLLQSCLAYGGPGRTALTFEPTYVMHYRQARMAGTMVRSCPRTEEFAIDVDAALETIEHERPEIVFVCSPNNPTGTMTPVADIVRIAHAAEPALVVVDEAYFEFCGMTVVPILNELPNVLVSRTFSKAFRLAGIRFGYAIASPEILDPMRAVRMPYSQSTFTQMAALIALRRRSEVLGMVPDIIVERERVAASLEKIGGMEVFRSGGNFVFFRHPRHAELLRSLTLRGIIVRDFSHLAGCRGCLRVTAGTAAENDAFLETVADLG